MLCSGACRGTFVSRGQSLFFMKKGAIRTGIPLLSYTKYRLSAESELLHDISVSLDVLLLEVVKEAASLADQLKKRKTGSIVLLVVLEVLGKMSDTVGK